MSDIEKILELHSPLQSLATRRAIIHGAVVLICAYFEAFVESLFEYAAKKLYDDLSEGELKQLFNQTSRRLHTPSVGNIDLLFYNLGVPAITSQISWKGWSNARVRQELTRLLKARQSIAHGSMKSHGHRKGITKDQAFQWIGVVRKSLDTLCSAVQAHVEAAK